MICYGFELKKSDMNVIMISEHDLLSEAKYKKRHDPKSYLSLSFLLKMNLKLMFLIVCFVALVECQLSVKNDENCLKRGPRCAFCKHGHHRESTTTTTTTTTTTPVSSPPTNTTTSTAILTP